MRPVVRVIRRPDAAMACAPAIVIAMLVGRFLLRMRGIVVRSARVDLDDFGGLWSIMDGARARGSERGNAPARPSDSRIIIAGSKSAPAFKQGSRFSQTCE